MAETCLVCHSALTQVVPEVFDTRFGVPQAYSIQRCTGCGLEQTTPRPAGAELGELYARHYNFGGEKGTRYTRWRAAFLTSPLYRLWMALDGDISFHGRPGSGRLLDIGCNEGRGLTLYARNGFSEVQGLETNPVAAAAARGKGFQVHECDIADFQPDQLFDVAVLSNVLEHALDPLDMLAQVKRILRPGGQVWISCPNARSWARAAFGPAWINWHVPFHITHFTDQTLAGTLQRAGFQVIEQDQVTPALWIAHSLIAKRWAKPGQATTQLRKAPLVLALLAALRGGAFPALWLGNTLGRGDCLIAIARTPSA